MLRSSWRVGYNSKLAARSRYAAITPSLNRKTANSRLCTSSHLIRLIISSPLSKGVRAYSS